jgi:tape measure domain-containing protein
MNETELQQLLVRVIGDSTMYCQMLTQTQGYTTSWASSIGLDMGRGTAGLGAFQNYAQLVLGVISQLIGVSAGLGTAFHAIQLAARAEDLKLVYGTLLRSADAGNKLVDNLQRLADTSPLQVTQLSNAARTLLQFGVAGDDIIPTLRMLGDVAGGNAEELQRIAYAYGEAKAQGQVYGYQLRQFISAGFNPLEEIAKKTGTSIGALKDESHHSGIGAVLTFDALKESIKAATSEGGRFHNMMATRAKSTVGLFTTMKDAIQGFLRTVGADIIEAFHLKAVMIEVIAGATQLKQSWANMDPTIRQLLYIAAAITGIGVVVVAIAPLVTGALGVLGTVVALALSPIGLGIALIVGVAAIWINHVGGMGAAWTIIKRAAQDAWSWTKQQAQDFWEWFRPVWYAFKDLAVAAWSQLKASAAEAWTWVRRQVNRLDQVLGDLWVDVKQQAGFTFDGFRDKVRDVFLAGEFAIRNFDVVWEVMVLGASVMWASFTADVDFFFTKQVPAMIQAFKDNWLDFLRAALFAGSGDFATAGRIMAELIAKGLAAAGQREKGPVERMLENDLAQAIVRMNAAFAEFKQRKDQGFANKNRGAEEGGFPGLAALFGIAKGAAAFGAGINVGEDFGQSIVQGAYKELHKFDSALLFSAEAATRLQDYRDNVLQEVFGQNARGPARPVANGLQPEIGLQAEMGAPVAALANDKAKEEELLEDWLDSAKAALQRNGLRIRAG